MVLYTLQLHIQCLTLTLGHQNIIIDFLLISTEYQINMTQYIL